MDKNGIEKWVCKLNWIQKKKKKEEIKILYVNKII